MRIATIALILVLGPFPGCSSKEEPPTPDVAHDGGVREARVDGTLDTALDLPADATPADAPRPDASAPTAWKEQSVSVTAPLLAIWGNSAKNIFAVGGGGLILRYDGSTWVSMTNQDTQDLHAIWGTGSTVFAAGNDTILLLTGSTWDADPEYYGWSGEAFRGLSGTSPTDLWAVGGGGMVQHRDSSGWNEETSGTTQDLTAVWSASASEVFVVGRAGTILKWGGTSFSKMTSGVSSDLQTIWGSAANDVWAAGLDGLLLHYDGSAWTKVDLGGTSSYFYGLWGSGAKEIFLVGSGVFKPAEAAFHYNGTTWTTLSAPKLTQFSAIWGSGPTDVYAIANLKILHYDGNP